MAEIDFLVVRKARSPRPRCWQGWFLLRLLSLFIEITICFLCAHMVFPLYLSVSSYLLIRIPVTLDYSSPQWPNFNLITSLEALSPNTVTFWCSGGLRFQHRNLGVIQLSTCIIDGLSCGPKRLLLHDLSLGSCPSLSLVYIGRLGGIFSVFFLKPCWSALWLHSRHSNTALPLNLEGYMARKENCFIAVKLFWFIFKICYNVELLRTFVSKAFRKTKLWDVLSESFITCFSGWNAKICSERDVPVVLILSFICALSMGMYQGITRGRCWVVHHLGRVYMKLEHQCSQDIYILKGDC